MVDELLDGFTFGPTTINDAVVGDHFAQHFWGEKNLGFSVLYHNMKHGQNAVKFLQDLVRESANTEDVYAKHLTKLAKQAANVPTVGSCAPVFEVIKTMAEKLSSCHGDVVLKLNELIKELAKYLEEQKGKHKQVKDQLSGTADALSLVQSTTASVKRSKEKYHQLCIDTERLKRSSAPTKDIERLETKSKRAADEYRGVVEKYAKARSDFEQKMTDSAKRFQDVEEAHLKHMKSVFEAYILSHENANVLINQVHQEFRRQVGLHSVDSLLQQYSVSKGTGTEKPGAIEFEECDLSAADLPAETPSVNGAASEDNNPAPPTKTNRIPIGLPFRKKKTGTRKSQKEGSSGGSNKGTDRDAESIESPDKESSVKIDDEGYTIRPETPKSTKNSWGFGSSGSDSDSDDAISRKIHVKIKPKEEALAESAGSDINTLNAITRNLTLNSPTPVGGKRLSPLYGANKAKQSPVDKTGKSFSDELLDLFGNTPATSAKPSAAALSATASANNVNAFADLFASKPDSPGTAARKSNMTSPLPPSSSNVSLNNLLVESSDKEVEMATRNQPSPRLPPPRSSSDLIDQAAKSSRPTDLSLSHSRPHPQKGFSSHSAPLASSESWSSLSSVAGTPMDSFASSRGPSPLTLMHGDPIPVAVAFTETVNAYFKGADNSRCIVRIIGEIQMSFPAGIVRAFTSNPNPPELSFKIQGASSLKDFTPNAGLLDMPRSDLSLSSFCFNMSALTTHIKKMTDANPNSPYYNVQVLSYQMASPSGYDLVPLHVSSSWTCEADSTDVRVEYKYNSKCSNATLKNVHVLVPVSGVISDVQSTPQANWIAAQNRLSWRLPAPITSSSVAGVLQSKLSLSSGPSKAAALAVQFMSEGSTLSGADFELTGTGYRLSLVKRRFVTGKYLCDAA